MRIAVSGSHWTGKTTLVDALCKALPEYVQVPEPYRYLEDQGHVFSERPTLEDFELQLACSLEQISDSAEKTIFDRCPLDFMAYITTHRDFASGDLDRLLPGIRSALDQLDFLVYVPVENPDVIACPDWAAAELRSRVDAELHELIRGVGLNFFEVRGSVGARVQQVLGHVGMALR